MTKISLRRILILSAVLFFSACDKSSNKEMIVGSWESLLSRENDIEAPGSFTSADNKIILTFNKDLTLKNEVMRNGQITSTNTGTYDFENDQKHLVVYREGRKERKNIA